MVCVWCFFRNDLNSNSYGVAVSWKKIKGYESFYEVSDGGEIRSSYRTKKVLKNNPNGTGYLYVVLCLNGVKKLHYVHRLVLSAFVGSPKKGFQAAHLDGNRSNNKLSNLRWLTPSENNLQKKLHGTWQGGENHGNTYFKNKDVLRIRRLRKKGKTLKEIGKIVGAPWQTIHSICERKVWKHL